MKVERSAIKSLFEYPNFKDQTFIKNFQYFYH